MKRLLLTLLALLALSAPCLALDLKVFNSGDQIKASDFNDIFGQIDSATNGAFTNEELYGEWSCEKVNVDGRCHSNKYYIADSSTLYSSAFFVANFKNDTSIGDRIDFSIDPTTEACTSNTVGNGMYARFAVKGDAFLSKTIDSNKFRFGTISKANKDKFILKIDNTLNNSTITCERNSKTPKAPSTSWTEQEMANYPCYTMHEPGKICLAWNDKSDNEDGFIIYRKLPEEPAMKEIARVGQNVNYFNDDPHNGTLYYVRSYNKYGMSAPISMLVDTQ